MKAIFTKVHPWRAQTVPIVIATCFLAACSADDVYGSAQTLQQHQCGKIADKVEYDRCMSRADSSYERP